MVASALMNAIHGNISEETGKRDGFLGFFKANRPARSKKAASP
ncbi:MAG: hypothetical protein P8166_06505 [Candidatus Thiodiazotropha sp.]|jgi:hypothetical protein